ncbi:MAG: DNA-binding protein, partial [Fervidicoccaceae archaeon]
MVEPRQGKIRLSCRNSRLTGGGIKMQSSFEETDLELEEVKRRKLAELQQRMIAEEERRKREAELEARRQAILRAALTPEARERLNNVKLVRPEIARLIEDQIIAMAQMGRLRAPVTDEELKRILMEVSSRSSRDIKITFKEK